MKTLALALLASIALAVPGQAQESAPQPKVLATMNECVDWNNLHRMLIDDHLEQPFVIADGVVNVVIPGSVASVANQMIMYVNPETYTYTIVALFSSDNIACVLSSGRNFRPFDQNADGTPL